MVFALGCFISLSLKANERDIDETGLTPIPIQDYFIEPSERLNWLGARAAFNQQQTIKHTSSNVPSLGIGSKPVWIRFTLHNLLTNNAKRQLLIDAPWIDHISLYQISESGELVDSQTAGDHEPRHFGFGPRPGHIFELHIPKGITDIFIRVETPDPMLLPVYLLTEEELDSHLSQYYYDYGFGYGYLLALIVFNALLYTGLRDSRYLYYAIYLGTFTLMNMSYSGLGQQWLWPNQFEWQRWAPPVTMSLFSIAGLCFALNLLDIQKQYKKFYKLTKLIIFLQIIGQTICWALDLQATAILLAFFSIVIYTLSMAAMGMMSYSNAENSTKYYLFAVAIGLIGVLLTLTSVWGVIPYTRLGYHAVEISMLLESTFLALALADRVRQVHLQQTRAEHLANTDPLTGLNNRRAFYLFSMNVWGNYLRHHRPLSAIMIDIDHFKLLNDNYGHSTGDQVLVHLSKLLLNKARQGDIITRWGGEEFLVLLPDTSKQEAMAIGERFRQAIQIATFKTNQKQLPITASFGLSEASPLDKSIDDLIERADTALYEAKISGRNCLKSI